MIAIQLDFKVHFYKNVLYHLLHQVQMYFNITVKFDIRRLCVET